MKSFKYFICEMKTIDRSEGLVHEPSHEHIGRMIDKSWGKEVRAIHHPDHGMFAWPSENKTHSSMIKHLATNHGYDIHDDPKTTKYLISKDKKTGAHIMHTTGAGHTDHTSLKNTENEKDYDKFHDRLQGND